MPYSVKYQAIYIHIKNFLYGNFGISFYKSKTISFNKTPYIKYKQITNCPIVDYLECLKKHPVL